MSNKNISYLNRNFDDYRNALLEYASKYYPQIANDFNDSSIGSWLIDLAASIGDNLSYYIDRSLGETNLETANLRSSVLNIARSNGLKIPGPKGAVAEVYFSIKVPVADNDTLVRNDGSTLGMPSEIYLPIIKKGTKVSSRGHVFEVIEDIDFANQFNSDGVSDRYIEEKKDSEGYVIVRKRGMVVAGESLIYRQVIKSNDIMPFMEIVIPDDNVMEVESVIFKTGTNYQYDPSINEFMMKSEYCNGGNGSKVEMYRFFEVDSLSDQYLWTDDLDDNGNEQTVIYGFNANNLGVTDIVVPVYSVTKGQWKPIRNKFITEFTDKGYLKIVFGSGLDTSQAISDGMDDYSKYQASKMVNNNFLGILPPPDTTMYVLYRKGGGATSNVAAGAINSIQYLNIEFPNGSTNAIVGKVRDSLRVTNLEPSVSGKDAPSVDEIKAMIKYSSASNGRCVTLKDYEDRVLKMPSRYGCPYRVAAIEENNKVMLFMLGVDNEGKLTNSFPVCMINNIRNYLSMYRTINDYVEIKSGEIINLSFEADIFVDKNYNTSDVVSTVISVIKDYMDIRKHHIGEDIFVGDLEKEINGLDGVLNLIELRVFNETSRNKYSQSTVSQPTYEESIIDVESGRKRIDLSKSNYILNSNADSMFEIRNPNNDIRVRVMKR